MAAAARARDAALATAIFTAGDCAAQQLEHGVDADTPATYSGERTAGASLLGLIWGGMISPTVYRFNESLYPGKQPRSVAKKIVLSVGLLGCCGNWALIFFRRLLTPSIPPSSPTSSPVGAAEPTAGISERISATARSVNKDFLTVMSHDLKVWPLADLLVFTLIPIRLRVAFVSSVSVCWQTYLSYTASQGTAASALPMALPTVADAGVAVGVVPTHTAANTAISKESAGERKTLIRSRTSSRPPIL